MGRSHGRIGYDELSFLNRQLASMARLNLPFTEGLQALKEEVDGREFKSLIGQLLAEMEEGRPLSEALAKRKDVFSDLYVGVVHAGEEAGDITTSLEGLARYSESMLFLRQRVKATLAYPAVAAGVAVAVTIFLFTVLVPKFQQIFSTLDIELPGITRFYLGVADAFRTKLDWILLGCLTLVALVLFLKRLATGARVIRQFALCLPFYGRLLRKIVLLRFCETLRALLSSNVSFVPALQLTARTLGDNVLRVTVNDMCKEAEEGRRVSEILRRNSIFPRTFVWKFSLAEEQGTLEPTLQELCDFQEKQLSSLTSRFSSLLEPFLIALVGLMVGSLVLSIFLPFFKMQSQLFTG